MFTTFRQGLDLSKMVLLLSKVDRVFKRFVNNFPSDHLVLHSDNDFFYPDTINHTAEDSVFITNFKL